MIKGIYVLLLAASTIMFAGCQRNYYSGSTGKEKGCGCPGKKGIW